MREIPEQGNVHFLVLASLQIQKSQEEAQALNIAADLAAAQGSYKEAEEMIEESLALSGRAEDPRRIASFTLFPWAQGESAKVQSLLEESRRFMGEVEDKEDMVYVLGLSGELAFRQGNLAAARSSIEERLALYDAARSHLALVALIDTPRTPGEFLALRLCHHHNRPRARLLNVQF
jgi:hypothetical protein